MHAGWRRAVAGLLTLMVLVSFAPVGYGQGMSLPDMLANAERAVYGSERPGALLERVIRLEQDVYGEQSTGALLSRVQNVHDYLIGAGGASSLVLQLNVVEYLVFERMSMGTGLSRRLDDLERNILGTTQDLPVAERAGMLVETVWPSRELNVRTVKVPAGELVKIRLLSEVNSATNRVGETVRYRVVQDVKIDDRIVIPAGAEGEGRISTVQSAARFGQAGRVSIDWGTVRTFDGTPVSLDVSERAAQQTQDLAVAASMAGAILAGPIGLVGGLLVQGKEHIVEAGAELFVSVARDAQVQGLSLTPSR